MNTIDPQTRHLLEHQARRMHHALHVERPPNRQEAARIQDRVDALLDRRPRPVAVTDAGEVLWEGTSPWVLAQAAQQVHATLPAGPQAPEVIEQAVRQFGRRLGIDDDGDSGDLVPA